MTRDKDFKRLIRERMQRTGESYALARKRLLEQQERLRQERAEARPNEVDRHRPTEEGGRQVERTPEISRSGKRAFLRDKPGLLTDTRIGLDGRRVVCQVPAAMLEAVAPETREGLVGALGSGTPIEEQQAIHALSGSGEAAPDVLEGLLASLAAGSPAAPMALTRYLDDPRVRPAILEAAEKASAEDLANFAQVLGMVGGEGSRRLLRQRIAELTEDPKTRDDHAFFNSRAGSLAALAQALLKLDPEASAAAEALLGLLEHPCGLNRQSAARNVAELLKPDLRTAAFDRLRQRLARLLETEDRQAFLAVAPALIRDPRLKGRVVARCRELLSCEDGRTRNLTAAALAGLPRPFAGIGAELVLEWLPREPSIKNRIQMAEACWVGLDPSLRREVVGQGLSDASPALRWETLAMLGKLPAAQRREQALEALEDEPDPALRKRLRLILDA